MVEIQGKTPLSLISLQYVGGNCGRHIEEVFRQYTVFIKLKIIQGFITATETD